VSEEVPGGCTRPVFRIPPRGGAAQIGDIRNHTAAVLVFGPDASADEVTATLDALPDTACSAIVFAARESLAGFQPLIDDDRLFYLACGQLPERELDALIDSALGERKPMATLDRYVTAATLRRIALVQSIVELTNALRAGRGDRGLRGAHPLRRLRRRARNAVGSWRIDCGEYGGGIGRLHFPDGPLGLPPPSRWRRALRS